MQAIILADGDVDLRDSLDAVWPGWLRPDPLVIAADGGARHAAGLGLRIDRWVGDGDSLGEAGLEALVAAGVPVDRARIDKDESDTELALHFAIAAGATEIVVLGAFGGTRVDHALANVMLLAMPELAGIDARLLGVGARVRLLSAVGPGREPRSVQLEGRVGDLVTLLPLGDDVGGVTTSGLRYPLSDETLLVGRARGLSNVRTSGSASVRIGSGRLLIVEAPDTLSG